MNYPMGQDFASQVQKSTEERVLRGNSVSDGPVRQAVLSQLPPGPVYPKPTPQVNQLSQHCMVQSRFSLELWRVYLVGMETISYQFSYIRPYFLHATNAFAIW